MDIDRWQKRLQELPLGNLYLYQEVGSTNTEAEQLAREGVPPFSLVVADAQTAGRGRMDRIWITRPGQALAFSLILYPQAEVHPEVLGRLSGMVALGVAEVLRQSYGLPAEIKWPNDVLVEGRKIAGILVEAHWEGGRLLDAILGVGVNVHREALPDDREFIFPATTLDDCSGEKASRLDLLVRILRSLLRWHNRLAEPSLIETWNELLAYKNQQVSLSSSRGVIARGELRGVEGDGSLSLLTERGEARQFLSGEIRLRLVDRS